MQLKFRKAAWVALLFISPTLFAQGPSGTLRGKVTDPSGAVIPGAIVLIKGPGNTTAAVKTNGQGQYVFLDLQPGKYTLQVSAANFMLYQKTGVTISAGKARVVNAQLAIATQEQKVTVASQTAQVSVAPQNNGSALILQGAALKSLSDDPDELQSELEALAGPSAGPNGGQIYIDGFSGGQLPPKSAILEVKVNQNPFTAAHAELGYGRIEIITKPGYQKFHGGVFSFGNDSVLNSRNPFAAQEPSYNSEMVNANVGGPLGKKASFFFDIFHRSLGNVSVVAANTIGAGPAFKLTPVNETLSSPMNMTGLFPRFDFQLSNNNVLSVQYHYTNQSATNQGVGQFSLPSLAFNSSTQENEIHLTDTQILGATAVSSLRFGFTHETDNQNPLSVNPEIIVPNYFSEGGSSAGLYAESHDHAELEDSLQVTHGRNNFIFGGKLRNLDESLTNRAGFNGTFTFASLAAYETMEADLAQGMTLTQIQQAGAGPSQFIMTSGNPAASENLFDAAAYAEDTRLIRPNLSLTLGLRLETQDHISNHLAFAPRLGLAWGIGRGAQPKTVLRAGFGLFYDRFGITDLLQAQQLNGTNQQRYMVMMPDFYSPTAAGLPALSTLASGNSSTPSMYQISPNLQAPYVIESAIGVDRQISRIAKASVTYVNTHGVHQLLTRDINAPLPGTYTACTVLSSIPCTPSPGVRPLGNIGDVYQFESAGNYNENQLIANFSVLAGARLTLFGYYSLSNANGDPTGLVMNPYNIREDYGPEPFAVRNRSLLGGTVGLPDNFQFSPFLMVTSGQPYNVTIAGTDFFGTGVFDARPAFAAPGATGPNIVATRLGTFNIAPSPGAALIPINYFTGPSQVSLNARIGKTFYFGKESGATGGPMWQRNQKGLGGRGLGGQSPSFFRPGGGENTKYQLELGIMAHNVFNHVNLGTPDGSLTPVPSPYFGESNSLASGFFGAGSGANRSINVMVRFSF